MITAEQRAARRRYVCSSDAAPILGIDPFRTQDDVYWSKVSDTDDVPTEAMRAGNRMEPALLTFAAEELGVELQPNVMLVSKGRDGGMCAANLDGLVIGRREAVEAKMVGPTMADAWGAPGTDEVPDHVNIQVQHQMHAAELDCVWVAAAVVRFNVEWRIYKVPRCQAIIDAMVDREMDFWRAHVLPKIPPTDAPPAIDVLRYLKRDPGKIVTLTEAAIEAWEEREAKAEAKKLAEYEYESATARVLALLGDAELGELPDGRTLVYCEESAGDRCDVKALRVKFPDAYQATCREGTRRILRLKKGAR